MSKLDKLSGLVVITGASTGIGLELAKLAAKDGCDLILAADTDLSEAEAAVRAAGAASVAVVEGDLATRDGIERLSAAIGGKPVDVLMANAGHGQGGAFLDQQWGQIAHVIHTNITGTVALIHRVGQDMRTRGAGRILVTGSIAGHLPGAFQLVYNSTKAFIDDFCVGLAEELKDTGVIITNLMPGATETEFFNRAGMADTRVGEQSKADPAKVAKDGYEALLSGTTQVTSGFMNKVQRVMGDLLPDGVVAQIHRRLAEPGGGKN
ncbi:SDR family NAD(P)-dependent oxidoreductase [Qipengyuania sediminis]|uniref:SDR family NAD(P)-dependent oxidoreductase n=1 Tax=Qipengyuania sediminis TaxID=1532023 RepID=UPI001F117132|nr:SDR family NAD(P)-dependent oxidoreductase [Qipengyuania sediminis]